MKIPDRPFLTEDFSQHGGGVDFLGLRAVNLNMVGGYLIPQINNVTRDMGTLCFAGWIPWKFAQLASEQRDFTERNYRVFRERMEVALSYQFRDDSDASREFGVVRNHVGITQELNLPSPLVFAKVARRDTLTLYGAAVYGPAVQYLGLVKSYRVWVGDGSTLRITKHQDATDATTIFETIDEQLKRSPAYSAIVCLGSPPATADQLDSLGKHGLHPALYRRKQFASLHTAFRRLLLPVDPTADGHARTRTTRLILATLDQRDGIDSEEMRNAWYTGMFSDGKTVRLCDAAIAEQRNNWALFMARQYQSVVLETLLWCFETALADGCSSIDDVVDFWLSRSADGKNKWPETFDRLLVDRCVAAGIATTAGDATMSAAWNAKVHAGHKAFEYDAQLQEDTPGYATCVLLAGWYWRMLARANDPTHKPLMEMGYGDRLSMAWFLNWLAERRTHSMRMFLRDAFSVLVFSQHIRVAISRYDGQAQRLRFMLGDHGIAHTKNASPVGTRPSRRMPDRLDTLIELLCDCGVLAMDGSSVHPGPAAETVK